MDASSVCRRSVYFTIFTIVKLELKESSLLISCILTAFRKLAAGIDPWFMLHTVSRLRSSGISLQLRVLWLYTGLIYSLMVYVPRVRLVLARCSD